MMLSSSLSSRLFGFLVTLYPEDLRRNYGAEMAIVFCEDLEAARHESGFWGSVSVWRRALVEFIRLALPGCLSCPAVRVPAFTLSGFLVMLGGCTGFGAHSDTGALVFDPLHLMLLLPVFSPPLIFLIAALWSRDAGADRLYLSNPGKEE